MIAWFMLCRYVMMATHTPTVLAAHADNDTTTYASSQVVLTCPAWTPARVNAFNIAFTLYNSPTGIASWGGASGYTGYFNANARNIFWDSGSPHQDYRCFHLIHGCDLYQAITATDQIAYDLGFLTPVLQASFNGPGLNFGAGPNQWKGIVLLGFD